MNVGQALEYFELKEVVRKLQAMSDVGLDYLGLGQPLNVFRAANVNASNSPANCAKKDDL
jgi:hypothetical protein